MWNRYGVELHLLQESPKNEENLAQLLHLSHSLKHRKGETFQGFDWFVATVFVLCGGNMERCVLTSHKLMFYMYTFLLPTSWDDTPSSQPLPNLQIFYLCQKKVGCNICLVSKLCNLYCGMLLKYDSLSSSSCTLIFWLYKFCWA
jgi:hypothetical protein